MQDQTTYPALLSSETIPVPLSMSLPPAAEPTPVNKTDWLRPVATVAALLATVLVLRHWW